MFKDTLEYQRLIKRTDPDGCGGDCENCDCWGSCSIARPIPDYDDGNDEE